MEALSANKRFACGDVVVYFTTVTVDPGATAGASQLTVDTFFDSRFGRFSNVGYTNVSALIATDDSQQNSDGGEQILAGSETSGSHGPDLVLSTTVTDVEAGETIVIEYRATLTCSDPPGPVIGNLQSGISGASVTPSGGSPATVNAGQQTVPFFANSISVTATPFDLTANQPACVDGAVTRPALTLPTEPPALTYAASPPGPYAPGDVVTVTATLAPSYSWPSTMPAGWTITLPTAATFTVTFTSATCTPVEPGDPTVIPGTQRGDGVVTPPQLILPETPGITYVPDPPPPYEPGDVITVIGELDNGYAWVDPLPPGWTKVDPDTATFTVVLGVTATGAPPPSATGAPPPSGTLPVTGSSTNGWIMLAATAALIAGFGLVAASRRKVTRPRR